MHFKVLVTIRDKFYCFWKVPAYHVLYMDFEVNFMGNPDLYSEMQIYFRKFTYISILVGYVKKFSWLH